MDNIECPNGHNANRDGPPRQEILRAIAEDRPWTQREARERLSYLTYGTLPEGFDPHIVDFLHLTARPDENGPWTRLSRKVGELVIGRYVRGEDLQAMRDLAGVATEEAVLHHIQAGLRRLRDALPNTGKIGALKRRYNPHGRHPVECISRRSRTPQMMQEQARAAWSNPDVRERIVEGIRRSWQGEGDASRSRRHAWSDPDRHEAHVEALRAAHQRRWQDPAQRPGLLEQVRDAARRSAEQRRAGNETR